MKPFNVAKRYGAKVLVGGTSLALSALTFAQTTPSNPADAGTALASLSGTTTAFGPYLFGLAVVATSIMLGVAWIKKARSAGR